MHCVDTTLCTGDAYARGRAYVFRGGQAMDATSDIVLNGDAANDWFGNTVAGVGDLNGDGLDDVAVGAIYADPIVGGVPLSAAGTVSVYFGARPMDPIRDALIPGDQTNSQFGWAIAAAGDIDGDGRRDFSASAHFYNSGATSGAGKIEVFGGGSTPTRPPLATFIGEGSNVQLGQSLAAARLVAPGGAPEIIAGEVYSRDVGPGSGKAFVLAPFCVRQRIDGGSVDWTSCYPFDTYDLYRGDVATDLPAGSYGQCLRTGLTGTSTPADPVDPPPGSAFFYLLAGRTSVLEGALGFDSSGLLRPNSSPCP
jgi:FG-GAP repeat protein